MKLCLLGAVSGDVIGSVYEFAHEQRYNFPLFTDASRITDDSVLTLAVADAILSGRSYLECVREYALAYPRMGYGGFFRAWMHADDPRPYGSYGNGSAMRVSAIGWAFNGMQEVLTQARLSAGITHDHPEGIKGAQAVALSILMARTGETRAAIKSGIADRFGYDLDARLDDIRPTYTFNETCQGTVPQAIIAFLESEDFEDAVRNAVSLGGDADTLGAIRASGHQARIAHADPERDRYRLPRGGLLRRSAPGDRGRGAPTDPREVVAGDRAVQLEVRRPGRRAAQRLVASLSSACNEAGPGP
jgi:ADP-ribosylglycohydrolase